MQRKITESIAFTWSQWCTALKNKSFWHIHTVRFTINNNIDTQRCATSLSFIDLQLSEIRSVWQLRDASRFIARRCEPNSMTIQFVANHCASKSILFDLSWSALRERIGKCDSCESLIEVPERSRRQNEDDIQNKSWTFEEVAYTVLKMVQPREFCFCFTYTHTHHSAEKKIKWHFFLDNRTKKPNRTKVSVSGEQILRSFIFQNWHGRTIFWILHWRIPYMRKFYSALNTRDGLNAWSNAMTVLHGIIKHCWLGHRLSRLVWFF